jgi:hypothetical protein
MIVPAPNGFFLHGMLWLDQPRGDAVLVKGYKIETQDVSSASQKIVNSRFEALANMLYNSPDNLRIQSQWRVTSDYSAIIADYEQSTEKAINEWTVFTREELVARLKDQMKSAKLRREEHILWFSKLIPTPISSILSTAKHVEKHINTILEREALSFE